MEEIWKEIKGYPNYMVSNMGNVKSLNYNGTGNERLLKLINIGNGYFRVVLSKNAEWKRFFVHRLVAMNFIPIPEYLKDIPIEKLQVNHKDENPSNNYVENLEWCTAKYNMNYGTARERTVEKCKGKKRSEETRKKLSILKKCKYNTKCSKPVLQINKNTNEIIKEFPSTKEVQRQLGYSQGNISECCNGKRNTHKGFIWRYK